MSRAPSAFGGINNERFATTLQSCSVALTNSATFQGTLKTMANFKVEQITGTTMNFVGEAPFYDGQTNNLFWTDIIGGQIFRMDLDTSRVYTARILGETVISFIVPVDGITNQFVIGAGKRVLLINWDGIHTMAQILRILTELPIEGVRFNDAKTDSRGRLYLGTMISEEVGNVFDFTKRVGSLYRFTIQEGLVELKTKVGVSNGLAFNDRTNAFYYVDSYDLNVKQFMYDVKTGNITGEKVLTDLSNYGTLKKNVPDGMTIDQEGNLYVAMFGGSRILKINTTNGKIITEIPMPVQQVTSMTFGGKKLDTMFVTTAGLDIVGPQTYPSGYLFKVKDLGVQGTEMKKFLIN